MSEILSQLNIFEKNKIKDSFEATINNIKNRENVWKAKLKIKKEKINEHLSILENMNELSKKFQKIFFMVNDKNPESLANVFGKILAAKDSEEVVAFQNKFLEKLEEFKKLIESVGGITTNVSAEVREEESEEKQEESVKTGDEDKEEIKAEQEEALIIQEFKNDLNNIIKDMNDVSGFVESLISLSDGFFKLSDEEKLQKVVELNNAYRSFINPLITVEKIHKNLVDKLEKLVSSSEKLAEKLEGKDEEIKDIKNSVETLKTKFEEIKKQLKIEEQIQK